jgi:phage-related protein
MFQVEFYKTRTGEEPVRQFLDTLPTGFRAKASRSLLILQDAGNRLREPYSKLIQDGVYELRVQFAGDIVRVFYFFFVGRKIIVTHGFKKKTAKTPRSEIDKALAYKEDYEKRAIK